MASIEKNSFSATTTVRDQSARAANLYGDTGFLRIPPFPGSRVRTLGGLLSGSGKGPSDLVDLVLKLKVGGTYWAAQPELPSSYILVRSPAALPSLELSEEPRVLWRANTPQDLGGAPAVVCGDCDPWHMLRDATKLIATAVDEVCVIAALLRVPVHLHDEASRISARLDLDAVSLLAHGLATEFRNPFTSKSMSAREAVELCGSWRQLIDSNRSIGGGLGFAFWKQKHVAPLLWSGSDSFRFLSSPLDVPKGGVAVWGAKVPADQLAELQDEQIPLIEVEDGFLRSQGLGADCVPPLSITVDRLGAFFDPGRPSELEILLQNGDFGEELLDRARRLRRMIVESGLGKYDRGGPVRRERPAGRRRHILVPGQVEDDRSVRSGGCGLRSNLDLLRRVRAQDRHAYITYKPHPDVMAGHRRGAISTRSCLEQADEIVADLPISALIDMVDEVHVNTSLAGFEALLREKPVTTYGVPFYAGWGLTRDIGPVPARRTVRRTLDELVAATLLMYPRYLDPETGLPCPAEIVADRLISDASGHSGVIVMMRRLQGKLMRVFRKLGQ